MSVMERSLYYNKIISIARYDFLYDFERRQAKNIIQLVFRNSCRIFSCICLIWHGIRNVASTTYIFRYHLLDKRVYATRARSYAWFDSVLDPRDAATTDRAYDFQMAWPRVVPISMRELVPASRLIRNSQITRRTVASSSMPRGGSQQKAELRFSGYSGFA